jgi:hypothetical protein
MKAQKVRISFNTTRNDIYLHFNHIPKKGHRILIGSILYIVDEVWHIFKDADQLPTITIFLYESE